MYWFREAEEEDLPVTRLPACGDELVWVKDHDLVLVVFVEKDTVHRRCIRRHDGESFPNQTEYTLHLLLLCLKVLFSSGSIPILLFSGVSKKGEVIY